MKLWESLCQQSIPVTKPSFTKFIIFLIDKFTDIFDVKHADFYIKFLIFYIVVGISSEINASCGQLDTITSFVLSLINRINVIMRFIQMQDEAQSTGLVEFRYRRDIVFSQTVCFSISVCSLVFNFFNKLNLI